jgi:hypothetical protein
MMELCSVCNKRISKMGHGSSSCIRSKTETAELKISTPDVSIRITERTREMEQMITLESKCVVQNSKYHIYV